MITVFRMVSFFGSISWILCILWPLLVTARYFFEAETAMFKGRSPKGNERPAGDRCHPFGSLTLFFERLVSSVSVCAGLNRYCTISNADRASFFISNEVVY